MRIEAGLFIGLLLSTIIITAFLLEMGLGRRIIRMNKQVQLKRRTCEVCSTSYFVAELLDYWRCPLCSSINKENSGEKST